MLEYDFGPKHPLKPQRVIDVMTVLGNPKTTDPGLGSREDLLRCHRPEYIDAIAQADTLTREELAVFGIGPGDTTWFPGMYESALAYCAGTAAAARAVCDGEQVAIAIAGGLHHAQSDHASGFCVFNDVAIACHILRERFDRVLYVDIDLHHGDGVQALFYDDPTVATLSIHQSGRTLYPGTGFVNETGANYTSVNIPLDPYTTGEIWLESVTVVFRKLLDSFRPRAIVLQMGCDAHTCDPLGHLQVSVQDFLAAVRLVYDSGLPIVAAGGGGYHLGNVPRMWASAICILSGNPIPDRLPQGLKNPYGGSEIIDPEEQTKRGQGESSASQVCAQVLANLSQME